ncbi:MAG TPA: hypothetical protein PLA11_16115, partial [Flavobacteriales bacterium]|nr:hypothetical protein [Flavobacteriales bacterium]
MRCERAWLIAFSGLLFPVLQAQDQPLLASDEFHIDEEQIADATLAIVAYDDYNPRIGGEAVRMGANGPCIGWVEDHYPDGVLQHKGYYDDGRLVIYKNYYPDGTLEREFRAID